MDNQNIQDPRTIGTRGLKGLNKSNDIPVLSVGQLLQAGNRASLETHPIEYLGNEFEGMGIGSSTYDKAASSVQQLEEIGDVRAQEQSGLIQLANGILKGTAIAGTTFLDGTVGALFGLVQGGAALFDDDQRTGFWENMFNNDFSKALREGNRALEEILPNYRSRDEIENPWALRNVFSMNTFADDFLKNMGFTVGAFYSGNAFLGGLKALKAAKWMSNTAAKTWGSIVSGFNEGRIEAGNLYDDMVKADTQNLEREYKPLFDSIMAEEDTLVYNPETGVAESSKQRKLQLLQERLNAAKKDIEDRATRAGIADMVLNTIYLPFNDMYMYGKLYGRGFKPKADLRGNITKGIDEAAKREAKKTLGDRIVREGREFITNPVSRKKAVARGLGMGLTEGAEEMNQAMFSTFTTSMNTPDSPDAYYKALTDPNYEVKTKDFMTSMVEAFQDSWLNPDTYKEGAVGFLTGIIGMPTFGKVNNSDHNTYLGRGKTVGLSGGIFGEMSNINYMNQQAENTVRTMNDFMKKVDDAEAFFVRSQSFTDAMDGWLEEGDKFEYENANDNDLFSAVDAFGRAGRIDDLKELVGEDFSNLTDEQLQDIAANSKSEEWLNPDGTSMASTPEGLNRMRQKLSEKQKKINEAIDSYEDALNEVRAYSNSGLTDDQTRELAWLKWKIGRFNERFKSIKEDNAEDIEDLRSAVSSFMNGRGRGMIDEESEEGKTIINNMGILSEFLDLLSQSKSPMQVASLMQAAKKGKLTDFFENMGYDLLEGMTGLDSKRFSDLMTSLKDTIRLADATKSFNDRYKEFLEDPTKLLQNRDKIDKGNQKVNDAKGKQSTVNTVRELSAGELAREATSGNVDLDNILAQMEGAEDGTSEGSTSHEQEKNKVKEAKELASAYDALRNQIQSSSEESEAARMDAQALLDAAFQNAESVDDLLDINSEAYLDARNLASQSDQMDMSAAMDLLEETRSFLNREMAEFRSATEASKQMPNGATKVGTIDLSDSSQPTGRDSQDKLRTEQEKNQGQQEQEDKKSAKEKIDRNFGVSLVNLIDSLPLSTEEKAQLSLLANAHKQDLDMHIDNGLTKEQINNIFLNDPINQQLLGSSPLFAGLFNNYIDDRIGRANPSSADNRTGVATPSSSDRLDRVGPRTPDITSTPSTTYDPVNSSNPIPGEDGGSKHYLRPSAWEDIPNRDGVVIPYESTLSPNSRIDQATIDRMKAVRNYLIDNGAFDAVNNGVAKVGSEVTFVVVPSLNESAGDIVILMQIGGQVVGDIPGRKYSTFGSYVGLTDLVSDIEAEYNKFHKDHPDDVFKYDKFKPKVTQNMVGKIPYVNTYSTLNQIFGDNVQLGLCLSWNSTPSMFYEGGQTRKSRSSKDAQVMLPNSPVIGMPYVLVETSDPKRKYWPVRIRMPRYDGGFGDTLGKAINSAIDDIANKAADPISLGEAILDLVAIDDIYIDYPDNDNVVVRIKQRGATNFTTVYNGLRNYIGFQEEIRSALKGNPYQVSRKYINGKYKFYNNGVPVEVSYNSMIGELATANLPVGLTHTKGDWFVTEAADGSSSIIRSIHLNPNAAGRETTITEGAITFTVDTNTWDVKVNGVIVDPEQKDVNTNKIRARVFGQVKGYDTTKPYVTKWGNYSTKSNKFVDNSPKTIGADPSLDIPSLDDLDAAVAQARADMGRMNNQGNGFNNPFRTQNRGIREAENAIAQAVADNRTLRREQALPNESGFTETGTSEVGVAFENDERAAEIQQALADSNRLKGEPPTRNYPQGNGLGRANSAVNQAVAENRRERAFVPPEGYNLNIWNEAPATQTIEPKKNVTPETVQDFIQINNTNMGFSRIFPLNEWNKKDQDIRLEPDGWGTKNRLTYYKKSYDSGRKGDNVTVWFKNEPSSRVKGQIEVFLERGRRLDDTETLAKILNGEVIFYPLTTSLIDQINRNYGGYFEGGGTYITNDYPSFNQALADKYEKFYLGDGEFTEDDAKAFLDEIARIEQAKRQGTQPRPNPEIDQLSASDARDMAKKKGLITGAKRQKVWEALTLDQQRRIASVPKVQGMKWIDTLEKSFNASNNTFNLVGYGSVDDLITNKPKFRLADEESNTDTLEREKTWLKKVLPQFSDEEHLQIIEGLIKVAGSDQLAYGQFLNGIITLGNKAARGTLYHEAFHAVANTLLTEDEYNQMMEAAEEVYGNLSTLDLEENLAEDFRRYVQLEETPVVGKLVRLFRKLKHFIQNLRGTGPYLNKLFYDINRGKFADRGLKDSNLTRYSTITASRLQSIVDNVVNRAYPINTRDRYTLKNSRINRNSAWGRWRRNMERQLDATIKGYLDVNGNWKVASVIPNGPKYRKVSENNSEMVNACASFLSNFDIKINEINDYTGETPLFDALNRVINPSSEDDIPRATGYAIAFMMRNHPEISKILELKLGLQGNLKGFRRSIRVRGSYELSGGRKIKELKNNKELFDSYIHEIGDDIATEINRLFKGESINTEDSFLQKIWNTISEFFDKMNPSNRTAFLLLSNYTKHIANAVKLGDATIVLSTDNKPETISEATIVDVAKALRENPYEDNIVKKLNEEGIALAGGASIALDGTLYRPSENPLHDLDFNAVGFEKEDIERVLGKYFPNYQHIRTINNSDSEGEKRTETYLILDRPFRVEKLPNVGIYGLFDTETGEKLGTYVGSEFTPLNGHKGKFLDFFVGEGNRHFPNKTIRANNHDYLISDSRNAWLAKFTYGSRAKDYWDYARFRKDGSPLRLGAPNEVVRDRISKANIIWGHPAIGKTFYLETHDDILEWDELINKERNEFFKNQIDPDNLMSPEEYKVARTEYMANYREHPEYIRFLTEKWNWLKDKAKKENKKILASPLPLMQMFADDFDLFITLTNKDFLVRNMARGGSLMGSLGWKEVIDASLVNVDQSKIIRTESYFSEVMEENPDIKQHNRDKLMFGFLNKDQQDYIKSRTGIEEYNNMSRDMKEVFLHCM